MKRKVLAIIMASLMVLTVLVMCSSVSADSQVTFWGRVTPIGTSGTVEVTGPEHGSCPIGPLGFYSITVGVKFPGASYTVTAYSNRGSKSKTIKNVNGGTYHINFHFGGIISVSYPQSKEASDIQDVTNSNPINNGQQTGETVENEVSMASSTFNDYEDSSSFSGSSSSSSSTSTQSGPSTISWLQRFFQQLK